MTIRRNMMKAKRNKTPVEGTSSRTSMSIRPLNWILLGPVLALLVLGHGFAAEWWEFPPPERHSQMWFKVDYDPKLTDPFFEYNEWSYSDACTTHEENPPRLKHTAKCFSNSMGGGEDMHLIRFCEARLVEGQMIVLLIHGNSPGFGDRLGVWIRNGMFTSKFSASAAFKRSRGPRRWTAKRQKLTLDKKAYQKGDYIKGRIDLEYIEEIRRHVATIKVYGVFKTILK